MGSTAVRSLDVARVRGLYLTVGAGTAYLDGPLSTLQPESVVRAIVATLRSSPTQPGGSSHRSRRSGASVCAAHSAFADLVGGAAEDVILGSTLAALQAQFAELLAVDWRLGDEIVLSRLDPDSVVTPWVRAARRIGASVRWAEVDVETGELPTWQYEQLIGRHTRLVTVALGNPATGTVPDARAIADLAHAAGALVLVDAGAAATHTPLDLQALGADLIAVSAASFGGPTVAAIVARPGLLLELDEPIETGPLPVELLDGATAAIDHLATLEEGAEGTRRERLAASVVAAGAHTAALWDHFIAAVDDMPHVFVFGGTVDRLPVFAFTVSGHSPTQVGEYLAGRGVSVWTGPAGMSQLMAAFGADELGGAVFAGFLPHTTRSEVDRLLAALADLS
ncbi:MAG TPA: aminotransferase class V-fold PLP-dependent enzyme [Jatrophihabitantaceae bacterium]